MRRRSVLATALVGATLLGCAKARGPGLLELTAWEPPDRVSCNLSGDDPLTALVDSAAAVAAVQSIGPSDGGLLLSVRPPPRRRGNEANGGAPDSEDSRTEPDEGHRVHRIETTLTEREAAAIEDVLVPMFAGSESGGRLLIRVTGGRVSEMSLGPIQACRPAMVNRWQVQRLLTGLARDLGETATVNVWLRVDTTGTVVESRVNRGTGNPIIDGAVLKVGREARFQPALIDRRPVAVWVALDLTIEVACPEIPDDEEWPRSLPDPCQRGRRPG